MSDWQYLSPMGVPQPGTPVVSGGGGKNDLTGYRDILDARRSAALPRTPDAEYPDGYLGNVNSRREDRLLSAVQSRLTQRNYQRGVHRGEKMPSGSYYWPDEFNPYSGLQRQGTTGLRQGPPGGLPEEQINHMGKNHLLPPDKLRQVASRYQVREITPVSNERQQAMSRLLPQWR